MKLTTFGQAIADVEAERLTEAHAAVEAGWTLADHPATCCPAEAKTPQPNREGRSIEELERLQDNAADEAIRWTKAAARKQAVINLAATREPQFDHGMLNTPISGRQQEAERDHKRWQELEHAKERAAHYERLANKYTAQIEKRKP